MADDVLHIIANHLEKALEITLFIEEELTPSKVTLNFSFSTTKPGLVARAGANPVANLSIFVVFTDCIVFFSCAGYNSS